MYTAAMIILWIAIILTVLEIIAKIFVQNRNNNQEKDQEQKENSQDKENNV